jgi:hypothetical protein
MDQLSFDLGGCAHEALDLVALPRSTAPAGLAWRAFSLDHPIADAVALFRARYGRNPEQVVRSLGLLLVGPVYAGRICEI